MFPDPVIVEQAPTDGGSDLSTWLAVAALVGVVFAIWLARRRARHQTAAAMAAVHLEGFEAGRAAVLASIGSTVVVNNQVGNGAAEFSPPDLDGATHDDIDRACDELGRRGDHDPRLLNGVPVGLHLGDLDGDARVARAASLRRHGFPVVELPKGRGPGS